MLAAATCVLLLLPVQVQPASSLPTPGGSVRIPLDANGQFDARHLVDTFAAAVDSPIQTPRFTLSLPAEGPAGALVLQSIAKRLAPGVKLDLDGRAILLTYDQSWIDPDQAADTSARLDALANHLQQEAERLRDDYGMKPLASYRPNDPRRPTIVLVHGMNSSSGCFIHLAPALEDAGFGVVVYDFPDNADLDRTSPRFTADWLTFRRATRDTQPWIIVTHSMGALPARDYVEGDSYANDVAQLILIAPPNHGSALARAQGLARLLQSVSLPGGRAGSLGDLQDGLGEAATDLVPGSPYLKRLNARPRRDGVTYHILAGDQGFLTTRQRQDLESRIDGMTRSAGLFGKFARLSTADLPAQLDELTSGTGDGAVSLQSVRLEGASEPVVLPANHVELIRAPLLYPDPGPIACLPQLLEWLNAQPAAPPR